MLSRGARQAFRNDTRLGARGHGEPARFRRQWMGPRKWRSGDCQGSGTGHFHSIPFTTPFLKGILGKESNMPLP